jgi:DNA topoisomerase-1
MAPMVGAARERNQMLLAARAAGLRYVDPADPGINRLKAGKGFRYADAAGRAVTDDEVLARIRSLVIPPAWTDVWISPSPRGHIQATGRDARGRKQYRYHPLWSQTRDETKYERTLAFARALPRLRRRVERDLRKPGLPREKVLAAVVRLLERTLVRVGNEEYARENRSFGVTTLRSRHATVSGQQLKLTFRGKSGKLHSVGLRDRRLAKVVRDCQELPGQHLFQYVDDEGETRRIGSDDVNEYLRDALGEDFSAKDFRTWAGTVLAARALRGLEGDPGPTPLAAAVKEVAHALGNTPAVCRRCYIHPRVVEAYLDGGLGDAPQGAAAPAKRGLTADERAVVALLRRRRRSTTKASSVSNTSAT